MRKGYEERKGCEERVGQGGKGGKRIRVQAASEHRKMTSRDDAEVDLWLGKLSVVARICRSTNTSDIIKRGRMALISSRAKQARPTRIPIGAVQQSMELQVRKGVLALLI